MAGTRIASVSGVRGVVGDGLDPAIVADFTAAYASGQPSGPIVVGHDGRVSAPVFLQAVLSAVTATGRDALLAGPVATPTLGRLVRDLGAAGGVQISASHNPPKYNGLKFFQPGGMVLGPAEGRAMLDRLEARALHWASWDALGRVRTLDEPDGGHLALVLATVDVEAIRRRNFSVVLDACHGSGGRLGEALLRALGCQSVVLGGIPDGRYDHIPEPTEANLGGFSKIVPALGAAVGFAQDPDADRLAIVDENGRYIGEELTLALAASHRLTQATGPVVLNLSTSKVTEDLAGRFGCPVIRTPVGEIHVVQAMKAHTAVLGGEGNGGVIDPRVGFVRDSFAAMALVLDLLATTDRPLSELVDALPRYSMVKDQYPLGGATVAVGDLFDQIAEAYPEAKADRRDGLRLDWPDRWVHVRSSNTEPIVRVIAEAPDASTARALAEGVGRRVTAGRES
ncbi:phosphoglucosamine mutase [Tundrisphaera lichenicola]|uniref:phosphoglucosamine mutase n=1 Tax=Tundrisphaera lichenicola TaxID=2029860 RepID=UPI003EB8DB8B